MVQLRDKSDGHQQQNLRDSSDWGEKEDRDSRDRRSSKEVCGFNLCNRDIWLSFRSDFV